jgi:hypothetical protein
MQIAAEINTWLKSSREYSDGLAILKKHSKSPIIGILSAGDDDFNRAKLIEKLQEILAKQPAPIATEAPKKKALKSESEGDTIATPYPARLIRLIAERKNLYAEVNNLKAKTIATEPGPGLQELAVQILQIWSRIDEIWGIQDHYDSTGELPADAAEVLAEKDKDPVLLMKSRSNLRSNISKTKGKIKKAKGAEKKMLELRLSNYESQLSDVENKITYVSALQQ